MYKISALKRVFYTFQEIVWSHLKVMIQKKTFKFLDNIKYIVIFTNANCSRRQFYCMGNRFNFLSNGDILNWYFAE